jgi:hypothetical protein
MGIRATAFSPFQGQSTTSAKTTVGSTWTSPARSSGRAVLCEIQAQLQILDTGRASHAQNHVHVPSDHDWKRYCTRRAEPWSRASTKIMFTILHVFAESAPPGSPPGHSRRLLQTSPPDLFNPSQDTLSGWHHSKQKIVVDHVIHHYLQATLDAKY